MPKGRISPRAKDEDRGQGQDLAKCQRAGYATILLRYEILLRYAARSVAA